MRAVQFSLSQVAEFATLVRATILRDRQFKMYLHIVFADYLIDGQSGGIFATQRIEFPFSQRHDRIEMFPVALIAKLNQPFAGKILFVRDLGPVVYVEM